MNCPLSDRVSKIVVSFVTIWQSIFSCILSPDMKLFRPLKASGRGNPWYTGREPYQLWKPTILGPEGAT